MTIAELRSNEALRQEEFPVARDKIFLAHAGVCPLPRRVADSIRDYAAQCTLGDQETLGPAFAMSKTRELAAKLLQAQPDEIAFVGPTSLALSFVAAGLPFKPGDNILVYLDDYPANVYPWMALAQKGVEVRYIETRELGRLEPDRIVCRLDARTRLVALASCHFVAGWRIDLQAIGSLLRQRGVWFCVDGIQTVGAFPTPVEYVDFLAADAHKWMLGPCAAGLLFVRKSLQDLMQPPIYGWNNVRCPEFVTQENLVLRRDAQRYEAGSTNLLGLVGLHAAMELLLEVGVENIQAELTRKRSWLVPALREKGYTVLHADAPAVNTAGIVTCFKPGEDMGMVHRRLMDANIVTSLRTCRAGRQYIRISAHFYNTDAELARAVEQL